MNEVERLEQVMRERDEARDEVETLRAAIDGEPWGGAALKRQRDEAVKRLGVTLEQLWTAEKERDEARAEVERLRAELRTVAERQREACVAMLARLSPDIPYIQVVRNTPLVTEGEP